MEQWMGVLGAKRRSIAVVGGSGKIVCGQGPKLLSYLVSALTDVNVQGR